MSLYTIGDLHLSFGCDKPMDIFAGWDNYVERIAKNWNSLITKDDLTVIAGDISWGMTLEQAKADFDFIERLNGKKLILKGNHDYWFSTKKKCDDFLSENGFDSIKILYNNAFEYGDYVVCGTRGWLNEQEETPDRRVLVREVGRLKLSLEAGKALGGQPIVFLHYPPVYYTSECSEIIELLEGYGVKKCYYGHIHGAALRYAIDGVYKGIDYRLISADYLEFKPVLVI